MFPGQGSLDTHAFILLAREGFCGLPENVCEDHQDLNPNDSIADNRGPGTGALS